MSGLLNYSNKRGGHLRKLGKFLGFRQVLTLGTRGVVGSRKMKERELKNCDAGLHAYIHLAARF